MNIEAFLAKLQGVKPAGAGKWTARCPAHDDRDPSLSIATGDDDRVLLTCHAGCTLEAICEALSITPADLFADNGSEGRERKIVATYDYTDEAGKLLYQVVRFTPKDFRQRRPDGAGGWIWKLGDTRRVLYRLPEVVATAKAGGMVYVVEGEKDADAIAKAGACATTNPGGAGKWRPAYSAALTGAHVTIVADKDAPGRAHAEAVHAALLPVVAQAAVVEAKTGKDACDHLAAGDGLGDFVTLEAEPDAPLAARFFLDWSTFWERDHDEAEWVYPDVLARGRGHAIYASHKAGKSLLMLWIAAELATGSAPVVVCYFDYENTEADVFDRLADMGYGAETDLSRLHYALLPTLPPLDTAAGAAALTEIVDGVQAAWPDHHVTVVIDTIARAVAGEENSADTYRGFYNHTGIELKRRGLTWARLDHSGKDPSLGQRGSSGKGDDVDVVWRLTRTQNGINLHRDLARMPWVPDRVTFGLFEEPLHYVRLAEDWPAGTAETADALDRLDVPLGNSVRAARKTLKDAGVGRGTTVIAAALRWRRERGASVPRNTCETLPGIVGGNGEER